ncbi:thioesterase family protein [Angustibacter luteus]|uniref:Thioesterase family protein n=1 Tax=Angustibacter luteus TaxID=658456 RepID=A0ABW1JE99_9ACTN
MTARFDEVTAVTRTSREPDGEPDGEPGRLEATIDPQWSIAGRTNGGYVLALMGRAAVLGVAAEREAAGRPPLPHPIAASATYLSPVPVGRVLLDVTVLRAGRTQSATRVTLRTPDGELRAEALVTCAELATDSEPVHDGVLPATLPPIEGCFRLPVEGPGFQVPIMEVLDERLDPACLGWAQGKPSGVGELRGYLSFADGRAMDPLGLLLAVDSLPPATFDVGLTGWVPTMQLSAWVRAVPAPGPVVVRQHARLIEGSLFDETCDIWDSRGRLVATGHQLAGIRVPRA